MVAVATRPARGDAAAWAALDAELDQWAAAGRTATLWWRDDDAGEPHPGLDRLFALAAAHGVPLALAVIPAAAEPTLADRVAAAPNVQVLQHGYAHRNHAAPGAKKCELTLMRPAATVIAELIAGRTRLAGLFGDRFRPVLVPPWNRIDAGLVAQLPAAGFRGLSTYAPRPAAFAGPGLKQANGHVDPIDWRGTRGFAGTAPALTALVRHLAARRRHEVDAAEPTGLLTHHRRHEPEAWAFLAALAARGAAHRAVRWLDAAAVFDPGSP